MWFQPKPFQTPDLPRRPFQVLLTFSHQTISQCPRDPRSLIYIIHPFFRSHTHPCPPSQLSRTLLCHPHRPTLTKLLSSGLTTLNYRLLPLGRISEILALRQRNIFLQQNLLVIPIPLLLLVHLTTQTSHPSNSSSMVSATDRRRFLVIPCKHSLLGVSDFFLRCLSCAVKEGSAKIAKGRELLGLDPRPCMVSIYLMFRDPRNYRNSFNYMSTSSPTI